VKGAPGRGRRGNNRANKLHGAGGTFLAAFSQWPELEGSVPLELREGTALDTMVPHVKAVSSREDCKVRGQERHQAPRGDLQGRDEEAVNSSYCVPGHVCFVGGWSHDCVQATHRGEASTAMLPAQLGAARRGGSGTELESPQLRVLVSVLGRVQGLDVHPRETEGWPRDNLLSRWVAVPTGYAMFGKEKNPR
jgi:hypothetical protein